MNKKDVIQKDLIHEKGLVSDDALEGVSGGACSDEPVKCGFCGSNNITIAKDYSFKYKDGPNTWHVWEVECHSCAMLFSHVHINRTTTTWDSKGWGGISYIPKNVM